MRGAWAGSGRCEYVGIEVLPAREDVVPVELPDVLATCGGGLVEGLGMGCDAMDGLCGGEWLVEIDEMVLPERSDEIGEGVVAL